MSVPRVFIGYDASETIAFHVAAHSVMRHSLEPVSVTPLMLWQLPMTRARNSRQSTDFTYSRFLVPWLCDYHGMAVFMDCDMLCRADIGELFRIAQRNNTAVSVVKHFYLPRTNQKFLGYQQTVYERKNWSSLMVFRNDLCQKLTPAYVNTATGLDLHQFKWLDDEDIGELPREWNHLIGEYDPNPEAKLAHFTLGTPCFARYRECEFSGEWFYERDMMNDYDRRGEFSKPARMEA